VLLWGCTWNELLVLIFAHIAVIAIADGNTVCIRYVHSVRSRESTGGLICHHHFHTHALDGGRDDLGDDACLHETCGEYQHVAWSQNCGTPIDRKAIKSESKNILVYMPMVFPNFLKIGGI
jgi:hypothetical protein